MLSSSEICGAKQQFCLLGEGAGMTLGHLCGSEA